MYSVKFVVMWLANLVLFLKRFRLKLIIHLNGLKRFSLQRTLPIHHLAGVGLQVAVPGVEKHQQEVENADKGLGRSNESVRDNL